MGLKSIDGLNFTREYAWQIDLAEFTYRQALAPESEASDQ